MSSGEWPRVIYFLDKYFLVEVRSVCIQQILELLLPMWYPMVMLLIYSLSQIYPHVVNYGRVDSATNTLKFRLSRPCNAGQECCLSYGNLSTSHLVTFYGFLPQGNNPYDVIPLGEFIALSHSSHEYFTNDQAAFKLDWSWYVFNTVLLVTIWWRLVLSDFFYILDNVLSDIN